MLLVGVDVLVSSLPCFVRDGKTWCALSHCLFRHLFEHEGGVRIPLVLSVWADCHSGIGVSWCVVVDALRRVTGWWGCLKNISTLWAPHIPFRLFPWWYEASGCSIGTCSQTQDPAHSAQPSASMLGQLDSNFRVVKAQWACQHCSLGCTTVYLIWLQHWFLKN